jgi:hypothetical protein
MAARIDARSRNPSSIDFRCGCWYAGVIAYILYRTDALKNDTTNVVTSAANCRAAAAADDDDAVLCTALKEGAHFVDDAYAGHAAFRSQIF